MRPAARLQTLSDLLAETLSATQAADQIVKNWGRANRYAGSKDRRFLSDALFTTLRHYGGLRERLGTDDPLLICMLAYVSCFDEAWPLDEVLALADGQNYAPAPLTEAQQEILRDAVARPATSRAGQLNVADWMLDDLDAGLGAACDEVLAAMATRAPLDVRVNRLKADADTALSALRDEGFEAAAHGHIDGALRVALPANVSQSKAFTDGLIEIQDAGAQAVALLGDAQAGDTVLDYCAGAGGKALALAASMGNRGRLIVHDGDRRRMRPITQRAERAGVSIIETGDEAMLATLEQGCDVVVADVPCSGSGRWRRAPETKWRLTPQQLTDLNQLQLEILLEAARYVRPGGRLVYATCSVFASENAAIIEQFLAAQPSFHRHTTALQALGFQHADAGLGEVQFHPLNYNTDGLFCAILGCEELLASA